MTDAQIRMKIAEYLDSQASPSLGTGSRFVDLTPVIQLTTQDAIEFDARHLSFMEGKGLIEVESRDPYRARLSSLGHDLLVDGELEHHLVPNVNEVDDLRTNGGYDVAQICLNGHVINEYATSYPEFNKNHCLQCGSKTIEKCPSCAENIQGFYHTPGAISVGGEKTAPRFCHSCGKPYPWTETAIAVAKELAHNIGLD